MSKIDDGGPLLSHPEICAGMTLRDYFAAQALSGWFANSASDLQFDLAPQMAKVCYLMADAMLKERKG